MTIVISGVRAKTDDGRIRLSDGKLLTGIYHPTSIGGGTGGAGRHSSQPAKKNKKKWGNVVK